MGRTSGGHGLPAGETAEAKWNGRGITANDAYVFRPHSNLFGRDLREDRLQSLSHGHRSRIDRNSAGAADPHNCRLKGPATRTLEPGGNAEAEKPALRKCLRPPQRKARIIPELQGQFETCGEVAAFIDNRAGGAR